MLLLIKGRLAQLVQSTSFTPRGSGVRTPHRPPLLSLLLIIKRIIGRLAQLVQSTSFTPRGSGVRTPHRPQKTPQTFSLRFFYALILLNLTRILNLIYFPSNISKKAYFFIEIHLFRYTHFLTLQVHPGYTHVFLRYTLNSNTLNHEY